MYLLSSLRTNTLRKSKWPNCCKDKMCLPRGCDDSERVSHGRAQCKECLCSSTITGSRTLECKECLCSFLFIVPCISEVGVRCHSSGNWRRGSFSEVSWSWAGTGGKAQEEERPCLWARVAGCASWRVMVSWWLCHWQVNLTLRHPK